MNRFSLRHMKTGSKLLLSVISIIIISLTIIINFMYSKAASLQTQAAYEKAFETSRVFSREIEAEFNAASNIIETIVLIFEGYQDYSDDSRRIIFNNILKNALEKNPIFIGIGTIWESDTLDNKDNLYAGKEGNDKKGRFAPYWNKINGKTNLSTMSGLESNWYKEVIDSGEQQILEPTTYPYITDKNVLVTTLVVPIKKGGEIIGVVKADIPLEKFQKIIDKIKPLEKEIESVTDEEKDAATKKQQAVEKTTNNIEETGYSFLLSHSGVFVAHHDKSLIGRNITILKADFNKKHKVLERLKTGKFFRFLDQDNEKINSLYIFSPVYIGWTSTPWCLAISIPEKQILTTVINMRYSALAFSVFITLLTGIIVFLITRKITRTIDSVKKETEIAINSILAGDLSFRTDIEKVSFEFRPMLDGLNNVIEAFLVPTNLTADYINRISKGDIPPKITEEYKGDFNEIKNSLNRCIDIFEDLLEQTQLNYSAVLAGTLNHRIDEKKYEGRWAKLVSGIDEIISTLVDSINFTAGYIEKISRGDIPDKITATYQGDFEKIKFNMNMLIDSMNNVTLVAEKISQGNFRVDVKERSEKDILMISMKKMTAELGNLIRNLANNTQMLSSSSEQLISISSHLVNSSDNLAEKSKNADYSTEKLADSIRIVASTAENMSLSVTSVSSSAEELSENTNTVAGAIEQMTATIRGISRNAENAEKTAEQATTEAVEAKAVMSVLGKAAAEIGKVTNLIKRIAEQTNLLALNATIEAASAGDAGKGFAVVANEIKELARQSAAAAEEIAEKIEGIQTNTTNAVHVIDDVSQVIATITSNVKSISHAVSEQTKTADEITTNMSEAAKGVQCIAISVSEIAKGAKNLSQTAITGAKNASDVADIIQEVSSISIDSKNASNKVSSAAEELANMAEELQNIVSKFEL